MPPILSKSKTLFTLLLVFSLFTETACWFKSEKEKESVGPKGNGGGYTGVIKPQKKLTLKSTLPAPRKKRQKTEIIHSSNEPKFVDAATGKEVSKDKEKTEKLEKLKWGNTSHELAEILESKEVVSEDVEEEKVADEEVVEEKTPQEEISLATDQGSEQIIVAQHESSASPISGNTQDSQSTKTEDYSWSSLTTRGAPQARGLPSAFWTGSQMLVYGGQTSGSNSLNTGGLYDPVTGSWRAISNQNAPQGRFFSSIVWTGRAMIVFGGMVTQPMNTGASYDLATDTWSSLPTLGAPDPCIRHSAVWTGSKMIIFGGATRSVNLSNSGYAYDPATKTWEALPLTNAPIARVTHSAVWTGEEMIIYGGSTRSGGALGGGRYSPKTNTWKPISIENIPESRVLHSVLWTGNKMIVFGGSANQNPAVLNTGGMYDPASDSWTPTSLQGAPTPRYGVALAWNGSKVLVYGGSKTLQDADRYLRAYEFSPDLNQWKTVETSDSQLIHYGASSVWTGSEFLIFGGQVAPTNDSFAAYPSNVGYQYGPR